MYEELRRFGVGVSADVDWWGEGGHTAADLKKKVREELNATKDDQRREKNE